MITTSEKYERAREQTRLRQKKFYDLNKAKVLEKKKEKRLECKQCMADDPPPVESLPDNRNIIERIQSLGLPEATEKKYINDMRTFMRLTDCEDLEKCLKYPKMIFKLVEEGSKKHSIEPYSINSKKSFIQVVVFVIDKLKIKLTKPTEKAYKDYFEKLKMLSTADNEAKQKENKVIDFDEYLNKVKTEFGEHSRQYLISRLYYEATVRDDFHLKIIKNVKSVTDPKQNYIIIPELPTGKIVLYIQSYKTESKYGIVKFDLSKDLSKLMRKYINDNGISYDDFLFGKPKTFTDFVSKMNKKIGVEGAINTFRHMKVSKMLADQGINDVEKRLRLSQEMMHSSIIQLKYLRDILKN